MPLSQDQLNSAQTPQQMAQTGANGTPTNQNITPSSLAPATPNDFQSPTPTAPVSVQSISTPAPITPPTDTTPPPTATDVQLKNLQDQLMGLNNADTGQSAYRTEQNTAKGISGLQGTVNDRTQTVNELTAGINALKLKDQNITLDNQKYQGIGVAAPIADIKGNSAHRQNQIEQNQIAVQGLFANAALQAAQGNLTLAMKSVDDAVTAKFAPIEEQIKATTANLNLILNSPQYTDEQKKKAADALVVAKQKEDAVAKQKADATSIGDTANKAAGMGADSLTIHAIQAATSPAEAIQIATAWGQKTGHPFSQNKPTTLSPGQALVDSSGKIIAQLPTASSFTIVKGSLDANGNMQPDKLLDTKTGKYSNLPSGATIVGGGEVLGTSASTTPDVQQFLQGRTQAQQDAFNAVPQNDRAGIMQLINGGMLLSDLIKSRGIQGTAATNKLLSQIQKVDPTFTPNNNKIKYDFMQNWSNPNGKIGVTRNAINTALGHLADFKTNADALNNDDLQFMNSAKNVLTTETGSPAVLQVRTDINALASEIATIYKGGGHPTEKEISNWENTIATNFSKTQFQGVSDEISKLLSSKITATRYQYKSVMGQNYSQSLVDPEKRQALIDAGINPDSIVKENISPNAGQTVKSNGQQFTVGQKYTDKSNSIWTIDADGKWSKQ